MKSMFSNFVTLHVFGHGESLGFAKVGRDWRHVHRHDGHESPVGPYYPTRTALLIGSSDYQRESWGIGGDYTIATEGELGMNPHTTPA